MGAITRAASAVALWAAVAGCERPEAVDIIPGSAADRRPPPEGMRPAFAGAGETYELCWITHSTADRDWVSRVHLRHDRPQWATQTGSDGSVARTVWTTVQDGAITRIERRDGRARDGVFELGEPTAYHYKDGQLLEYTHRDTTIRYRDDGRVVLATDGSGYRSDVWSYDADGHAVGRRLTDPDIYPSLSWAWTWEGDRLVQSVQGGTLTEWVEHDGDLPVRSETSWIDVSTGDARSSTDLWTWESGRPTSWARLDTDGAENVLATWTWDGDLLLTSTFASSSEEWTWDEEGRAVGWEALDASGRVKEWRTWSWDEDRLVHYEWSVGRIWLSTTWGRACPPAAWATDAPWPWTHTPIPGWPVKAPLPNEW